MHKPFVLFAFDDYYPRGGSYDVVGTFATLEEAKDAAECIRERPEDVQTFNEVIDFTDGVNSVAFCNAEDPGTARPNGLNWYPSREAYIRKD